VEQDFINELNILKDIKASGYKCFPILKDWGETNIETTYQVYEIKDKSKFFIQSKLGRGISTIFYKYKKNFKKIDVLKIGIQLLKVIERFHSLGYVHRDIKPDNILIDPNRNYKEYENVNLNHDSDLKEYIKRGRLKLDRNDPYHTL
jgi:serine/threonine protein kinase